MVTSECGESCGASSRQICGIAAKKVVRQSRTEACQTDPGRQQCRLHGHVRVAIPSLVGNEFWTTFMQDAPYSLSDSHQHIDGFRARLNDPNDLGRDVPALELVQLNGFIDAFDRATYCAYYYVTEW